MTKTNVTKACLCIFAIAGALRALAGCGSDEFVSTTDAGSDATGDANSSFCSTSEGQAADFCDDFDEGPLAAKWDHRPTSLGATIQKGERNVSPPYSFLATTPSVGSDTSGFAFLDKALLLASGKNTIRFRFSLFVNSLTFPDTTGTVQGAQIAFTDVDSVSIGANYAGSFVLVQSSAIADGGTLVYPLVQALAPKTWVRVTLTLSVDPTNPTLTVALDDATILDHKPSLAKPPTGPGYVVRLGTVAKGSVDSTTIFFDNVTVVTE